jgi:hypothetical protein
MFAHRAMYFPSPACGRGCPEGAGEGCELGGANSLSPPAARDPLPQAGEGKKQ